MKLLGITTNIPCAFHVEFECLGELKQKRLFLIPMERWAGAPLCHKDEDEASQRNVFPNI